MSCRIKDNTIKALPLRMNRGLVKFVITSALISNTAQLAGISPPATVSSQTRLTDATCWQETVAAALDVHGRAHR